MIALILAAAAATSGRADVVLSFPAVKDTGVVRVALYDSEASYRSRAHPLRTANVPVRGGKAEAVFKDLAPGVYAAMVFHDLNSDGRMNFRFGFPLEPYAFSNNARGLPLAGWGAARFDAPAGETRQSIGLK